MGFIKHQYLNDNISKVVNIIDWAQKDTNSMVLICLDVEKAFNRVE